MNLDEIRESFTENFSSLLPILMIALIGVGNTLFCATSVFPAWSAHQELVSQVEINQGKLDAREQALLEDSDSVVLQAQIDSAKTKLDEAANVLLTQLEVDKFIDTLYHYADASQVEITSMEAQPPASVNNGKRTAKNTNANTESAEAQVYETRVFHLQVEGSAPQLVNFIARIQEASLPSVNLANITITSNTQAVLAIDILVYMSPYASGQVVSGLPLVNTLTPIPPTPTPIPPTPTLLPITPTPTVDTAALDTMTTLPGTMLPDTVLAAATVAACPGAPPTLFQAGDTVVVDFNQEGALRILTHIGGTAKDTLALAYDNRRLLLLDGPVCGESNGVGTWYWHVDRAGYKGWAAEAAGDQRWMCPEHNPECA